MSVILWIVLALVVFTIIVFIHELGHFSTAKLFRVKVEEFGLGIPPKAKTLHRDASGTEYTLNWLPIGGFVRMKWEDVGSEQTWEKDTFSSKSLWKQMIIILAGVFMNFLLASFIFSFLFYTGVEPLAVNTKFPTNIESKLIPTFDQALEVGLVKADGITLSPVSGGIAQESGIQNNDILLSVNWQKVSDPQEVIDAVWKNTSLELQIRSENGQEKTVSIIPQDGKIGAYIGYNITGIDTDFRYEFPLSTAIYEWVAETYRQSAMTLGLFRSMLQKIFLPRIPEERAQAVENLGGPIAVGNLFVNLVDIKASVTMIAIIAALISVNLGVFNLLPFPALDGGRFFFLALNGIVGALFGKKFFQGNLEQFIHLIGFVILILLSIFVAYNDVAKIITS